MNPNYYKEAPHNIDDPMVQHLRFVQNGNKLTWKETLEAMCRYYGTFRGRWHENEYWKATLKKAPSLTEQQALDMVLQIEREADADLWYWGFRDKERRGWLVLFRVSS